MCIAIKKTLGENRRDMGRSFVTTGINRMVMVMVMVMVRMMMAIVIIALQ